MTKKTTAVQSPVFEQIKKTDENGNEYWGARELAKVLDYSDFRNFSMVIAKAKEACINSSENVEDHIVDFTEMVPIGSSANRMMSSVKLSRYACYLVVQNADPGKEVVALGQTYFAIQTRLLDHMGSVELAANLFRTTQAEDKLRMENIKGKEQANITHFKVGQKVRKTIKELGGAMPETLPSVTSIKQLNKKPKNKPKPMK